MSYLIAPPANIAITVRDRIKTFLEPVQLQSGVAFMAPVQLGAQYLQKEVTLSQNKWFDYRFITPVS